MRTFQDQLRHGGRLSAVARGPQLTVVKRSRASLWVRVGDRKMPLRSDLRRSPDSAILPVPTPLRSVSQAARRRSGDIRNPPGAECTANAIQEWLATTHLVRAIASGAAVPRILHLASEKQVGIGFALRELNGRSPPVFRPRRELHSAGTKKPTGESAILRTRNRSGETVASKSCFSYFQLYSSSRFPVNGLLLRSNRRGAPAGRTVS